MDSSIRHHMEQSNGVILPQTRDVDVVGGVGGGYHICGVLLQDFKVSVGPSAGLSRNVSQHR